MGQENKRIARISFFAKGKKFGDATGGSLTMNSNDEDAITDNGWNCTDGTQTSEIKLDTINAVDGETDLLDEAMTNKEYILVQVTSIGGKQRSGRMRVTQAQYDWTNDKGSAKGSFSLRGGKLKKV